MGFQHALAMLGGIVSVPLIVGGPFDAKLSSEEKEYLISAGLISSGLLSIIQIYRLKLGDSGYYLGTGPCAVALCSVRAYSSTRETTTNHGE
jgi:xanthine/uracil permease